MGQITAFLIGIAIILIVAHIKDVDKTLEEKEK